jgi:transposase
MSIKLSDQHLIQVATLYSRAMSDQRPPAPVIAEHFGRPVATVHRWVAKARERGFLPPTRPGLASGDEGLAPVLAAELGIKTSALLAALSKHSMRLGVRRGVA